KFNSRGKENLCRWIDHHIASQLLEVHQLVQSSRHRVRAPSDGGRLTTHLYQSNTEISSSERQIPHFPLLQARMANRNRLYLVLRQTERCSANPLGMPHPQQCFRKFHRVKVQDS